MTAVSDLIPPAGLCITGHAPADGGAAVLVSPDEPGFWSLFTASPEYGDGLPDPMDRWSKRIIGTWAAELGVPAVFPSDGPPYPPFAAWALASGRCFSSPIGMLVHDRMGLFISFRGALILPQPPPESPAQPSPCAKCHQPCLTACPAGAFRPAYDTRACHAHLNQIAGQDCLSMGCIARRACPISQGCGRLPEQSAWHMRAFHP
ncbi:MAG: ferredoxin [Paracoccus sp. (in: a-proteobacteria)]|uniref:ferredoxin n=1 Tax=Paracoccus sp. TaxID=267 RepID=UPI0026DEC30F|nr:ferredoxin [Paracoccus sp. (in: a-proteobacteria)]MDO5613610.1 ferredoxin [Paracoccus sp. (in: a-proteobacteria)]